jgi:hypothetical protein
MIQRTRSRLCVDEKYQIQGAGRMVSVLPMQPGLILAKPTVQQLRVRARTCLRGRGLGDLLDRGGLRLDVPLGQRPRQQPADPGQRTGHGQG